MKNFVHLSEKYKSEEVISKELNGGRYYLSPTKKLWYPSVTTVTGYSKKDFFKEWRQNPENQKELTRASVRGTKLHSIIEKYIQNDPEYDLNVDVFVCDLFEQIKPEIHKINNIHLQEQAMWSDYLKMAGRVDCIAEYEGKLSIIDFKGSKKEKKEDWITNYFEQTCAYALMFQERFNVPILQTVVLVACETGSNQVFIKPTTEYLPSLKNTIDNYWKDNCFDTLQNAMNSEV